MDTTITYRNFNTHAELCAYERAVILRHGWNTTTYPLHTFNNEGEITLPCWILEIHVPTDAALRRPVDPTVQIPRYLPIPERG